MIEHVWSVLCSDSVIDRDTNNLSLINVLEQWSITLDVELPVVVGIPLMLVTMWSRVDLNEPAMGRARITILSPSRIIRECSDYEIDLTQFRRFRSRYGFQGFEVIEEGKYVFQVEQLVEGDGGESQIVARVPLEILVSDSSSSQ